MSGIAERLAEVLRKCRVDDDAPIPLLNESDRYHVLHMLLPVVEREIAAARGEVVARVEALEREWALTEFPDARTADLMRLDLARLRAALSPDPDRGEGEGA